VLLPVVLYPLLIPLLITGVKGVGGIIGNDPGMVAFSIKFILFYDVLFAAVALWTFESLVIE
jgi:ABC-type transport system involved in cytochrome c biogenesis permease component